MRHQSDLSTAQSIFKVTKADTPLPKGTCAAINCGTAGTANLIDAAGNTCPNYPLQAGYNLIQVAQVSLGGTADDIWALY